MLMGVMQAGQNLRHDPQRFLDGYGFFLQKMFIEGPPLNEFHDQHQIFIAEINYLNNVGMVQLSEKVCFFLKSGFNILIIDEAGLEFFGGNPAANGQLVCLVNIGHPAFI